MSRPDGHNKVDRPEKLSPKEYFNVVLPAILKWKGSEATAMGVNVRFVVTGRGGGTWTIRLRPPKAGVVPGKDWKADLTVKITTGEMKNILLGKFNPKAALESGNIELKGDLSVLKRVAFLFAAGAAPRPAKPMANETSVSEAQSA